MTDHRASLPESLDTTHMVTALVQLRGALQHARLPLQVPGAEEQRHAQAEMVDQLEDYVIPRLMTVDAPMLTVVGGSTGALLVPALGLVAVGTVGTAVFRTWWIAARLP